MKKDKKTLSEEETSFESKEKDEDLEKLYEELENDNFSTNSNSSSTEEEINNDSVEESTLVDLEDSDDEELEELPKEEIDEEVSITKKEKPSKEKKEKGKIKWQTIFNLLSILFLLGCTIFYGCRLVKYYKIYNPKSEDGKALISIGTQVKDENPVVSSGDGLYNVNGELVFKGVEVNNYVKYSNMLWRIVKVTKENSVILVTDEVVNNLIWSNEGTNYLKSEINTWLNSGKEEHSGIFENVLTDKGKYLSHMSVCVDEVNDLKNIVCSDYKEVGYLGILGITDYANSINEDSYLNNTENIWFYNTSKDKIWNVTKGNITSSEPTNGYGVKATIMLKTNVVIQSGKGTKDDPYKIDEGNESSRVGKYVDLNGDIWQIYEDNKDTMRLVYNKLYNDGDTTYKFSSDGNKFNPLVPYSLAYHLNNSMYKAFNYNDIIEECEWYIGDYSDGEKYDYRNVYKEKINAKVGLYNVADIKLNNELSDYYYLTPDGEDKVYGANKDTNLYSMRYTYMKSIRPAICIKNTKFIGNGTENNPYKLEGNNEKK